MTVNVTVCNSNSNQPQGAAASCQTPQHACRGWRPGPCPQKSNGPSLGLTSAESAALRGFPGSETKPQHTQQMMTYNTDGSSTDAFQVLYTNLHDRLCISGNLQAPICYNITLITNAAPTRMPDAGAAVSPAGGGESSGA